jgi:hypothetical protein
MHPQMHEPSSPHLALYSLYITLYFTPCSGLTFLSPSSHHMTMYRVSHLASHLLIASQWDGTVFKKHQLLHTIWHTILGSFSPNCNPSCVQGDASDGGFSPNEAFSFFVHHANLDRSAMTWQVGALAADDRGLPGVWQVGALLMTGVCRHLLFLGVESYEPVAAFLPYARPPLPWALADLVVTATKGPGSGVLYCTHGVLYWL